ncbi:hypothetical protein B0T25DRAFT_174432 [Lasiosphaeria hispida]|uniref:Uncharacterized protein n=1 Tax=Lasiosphaeria hispida TaxID=260671 RepID=A0AAJ0HNN0_9PEZI|nr:hypothetical protein B0T25DRAFT_174432 [Lasiosphaeria hispida]
MQGVKSRIITGNATFNGITKDNIDKLIWRGPYKGCTTLCPQPTIQWNTPQTALNIAATWIFPLAVLLGLPFEPHHTRKIRRTPGAISNRLGSPQTALTAAVWNFRQTRDCHRRVRDADMNWVWTDAYYILSCLDQFELGLGDDGREEMVGMLMYGLFRPLSSTMVGG